MDTDDLQQMGHEELVEAFDEAITRCTQLRGLAANQDYVASDGWSKRAHRYKEELLRRLKHNS